MWSGSESSCTNFNAADRKGRRRARSVDYHAVGAAAGSPRAGRALALDPAHRRLEGHALVYERSTPRDWIPTDSGILVVGRNFPAPYANTRCASPSAAMFVSQKHSDGCHDATEGRSALPGKVCHRAGRQAANTCGPAAAGNKTLGDPRKAEVVAAVRGGLISLEEACERYAMAREELLSWSNSVEQHGLRGLRTTKIQHYRP